MTDTKVLEKLAEQELRQANSKFPQFHSLHEGYAVIKEEVEEAEEAIKDANFELTAIWGDIKANYHEHWGSIKALKGYALSAAAEAIQVAAMAQKMLDFLEGQNHE